MPENPAHTLYRAWDGLFQTTLSRQQRKRLKEMLPTHSHAELTKRPYMFDRWRWSTHAHIINHRTGIEPVAQDVKGNYIYTMGYLQGGTVVNPLFQIDASGNFRLGSAFSYYATRGAYDRVQHHTFLGWDRTYGRPSRRIWWYRGFESDTSWCNERDWRTHTYHWSESALPTSTWLQLCRISNSWRVMVAAAQDDYAALDERLMHQYRKAEEYYAKWRRRYHKEQGLPDPDKLLDGSDIETVDYITQHLRVYDPPKAQMPT